MTDATTLTREQREALRIFGDALEELRAEADAAIVEVARRIPVFAAILASMDERQRELELARSRELERRAIHGDDWAPYLEHLRTQGVVYAELGVELRDWYALLGAYRGVVIQGAVCADRSTAAAVLDGMGLFLDIAMSAIGESYLATKEAMIASHQRELARHIRELERSNRELDDFAFVASHDLKAPLRDILTLTQWVIEDGADALPSESRRHLALIGERITRMERLLDDLLQYSRAGRAADRHERFEVRRAVQDAASVTIPVSGFELSVSGDAPTVRTARAPLELVLRNLLGNAVKHHHRGAGRVDVRIASRGSELSIEVTDDGPGIDAEFHERVFRMFQTLRPRDEVEGSGMGLAIVKKIVEGRGGQVSLRSSPGEGTSIGFTWPTMPETDA